MVMAKAGVPVRNERRKVYRLVREKIIALELLPGSAISENDLARTVGVSRTPIREALLLLTEEKLVEVFPKVGTFVSRVDPRHVAEAHFLREAVEIASIRTLVPPYDAPSLDALRANLAKQREVSGDSVRFFELDEDFHRGMMALAGHEDSWSTVVAAKGHLDRARMLGMQQVPKHEQFIEEHHRIFEAIVAGNLAGAEELLSAHLGVVFSDLERIRESSPELFVGGDGGRPMRKPVHLWE